jgi:hypothetical protein
MADADNLRMVKRRHKQDTRTFEELDFSEQAKSISAQLVNLGRAIRHHARQEKVTALKKAKLLDQVNRFAQRMTAALEP